MTDTKNPRLLIRVGEAAEMLSIARSKAYVMVQTGELPSVRLGKSVRVPLQALNLWLEKQVAEAARA
jgi:excisionase family DNA binding protein